MAIKKLYRSEDNKIVAGVIGGIGEYLDIDPTILRVIWLIILIFSGVLPALLVYVLALLIIPRKESSEKKEDKKDVSDTKKEKDGSTPPQIQW